MIQNVPRLALPRLLITAVPPDAVLAHARRSFEVTVWDRPQPIGAEILTAAAGHDALVVMPGDKLDSLALASLPSSIAAVGTYSVGFDHIDLQAATARGLPVFHTPDVLTEAVADLAIFLLIAAARGTSAAERTLREGRWGPWAPTSMLGRSLQGMNLGVFGMGRIGQAVATRARSFGMRMHYHNRSRLDSEREAGASYHSSLDALLMASDALCICAPASPDLKGVIDARRLALLPKGALLVNAARGDLVDELALFNAMTTGQVAAVATDVFCSEPRIDPRWLALRNATLLPHIGSATQEVRTAMGMLVIDGIAAHFSQGNGGRCLNPQVYGERAQ